VFKVRVVAVPNSRVFCTFPRAPINSITYNFGVVHACIIQLTDMPNQIYVFFQTFDNDFNEFGVTLPETAAAFGTATGLL